MTIFYQCDFCPEGERKPVQHGPNSQFTTIVGNMRDGDVSVICEKCVRFAFEKVENNAIKYKNRQDKQEKIMNKVTYKVIKKWRDATEGVAKTFVKKYYPEQRYGIDTFWVCDHIGDVFFIADMFFDLDRMLEALELDATLDQLCDYHDAELEHYEKDSEKPMPVNFKNYVKYGFEQKEEE